MEYEILKKLKLIVTILKELTNTMECIRIDLAEIKENKENE